jgi:sugar-specific transcriptional regulator TrmB
MYYCYTMDEKLLISFGLSQTQARAYRALLLRKSLRPSQLSKMIGESRTNCYALLDRLVELGLAAKTDENKKFTYYPASPTSLRILLEKNLEKTEYQLQELDRRLPQMLSDFHAGGEQPKVSHYKGKKELEQMYIKQMEEPGRYFSTPKPTLERMLKQAV